MRALDECKGHHCVSENACFGGGADTAACDIVIAFEDARFAITEVRLGNNASPNIKSGDQGIGRTPSAATPLLRRPSMLIEPRTLGSCMRSVPLQVDDAAELTIDAILRNGPIAVEDQRDDRDIFRHQPLG